MKSNKRLQKIAEKVAKLELEAQHNPSKLNEIEQSINQLISNLSMEELLELDDIIYSLTS